MHPVFASIQYGPFSTSYHRSVVTDAFREALSIFLEEAVLAQVDEPFDATEGRLTAVVNDEKHCGPNSLVKDIYKLEFAFIRDGSSDCLRDEFRFDRKSNSFVRRWKHRPVIVWTQRRREREKALLPTVKEMLARLARHEPGRWICPRCDAELTVIDTGESIRLSCPIDCFKASHHRKPQARMVMGRRMQIRGAYHSYPRCRPTRSHPEMKGLV